MVTIMNLSAFGKYGHWRYTRGHPTLPQLTLHKEKYNVNLLFMVHQPDAIFNAERICTTCGLLKVALTLDGNHTCTIYIRPDSQLPFPNLITWPLPL